MSLIVDCWSFFLIELIAEIVDCVVEIELGFAVVVCIVELGFVWRL